MSDAVQGGKSIEAGVTASRAGRDEDLSRWLEEGGDPNGHDGEGWTPLLAAAVRGHESTVKLLLGRGADPDVAHGKSQALPIHFAGHSGSVPVAEQILALRPDHLEAVWDINGHTLILQTVFYGHLELTRYALEKGANTAATTLRGLAPLEFAQQFANHPLMDLIRPCDSPREAKDEYYKALLEKIAPVTPPEEREAQELADRFVRIVQEGLGKVAEDGSLIEGLIGEIRAMIVEEKADVNRLGGVLRQPALVVAVTGNNGDPANEDVARFRKEAAALLLEHGADPTLQEEHPMGAHPVIRASVFNHLDVLKMMGERLTAGKLAGALNDIPVVNGLTALHDTVLRASMTSPERLEGYLDQIRWEVASGARYDIEDFSGRTQLSIAEAATDPVRRQQLLDALGA